MHPKKLLVYTENYARGGGNQYLLDLCDATPKTVSVSVLGNKNAFSDKEVQTLSNLGATIQKFSIFSWGELRIQMGATPSFSIKLLWKVCHGLLLPIVWLYQLIRFQIYVLKIRPTHILLANGGFPGGTSNYRLAIIGALNRIPMSLSVVSTPAKGVRNEIIQRLWLPLLKTCVDHLIVNSQKIQSALCELGFDPQKIIVLYNGRKDPHPQGLPQKPSLPVRVLFLSRIEQEKGIYTFIQALTNLSDLQNQFTVDIIGEGSVLNDLKETSKIFRNLTVHGYLNQSPREFYQLAQIYVLPSFQEGLPYTIVEAMSHGCAIIATQVGGIPEMITDGFSGILIAPQDVAALSNALAKLIRSPDLCSTMGQRAREDFLAKFEYSKTKKNMTAFLEQLD